MPLAGRSSNDLINMQASGYFGLLRQTSRLIVQYSKHWPCLRLLYHLNVQQSHMLPYSTLYVAIVTLQCFHGIYNQQDVWCKCVPCSEWTSQGPVLPPWTGPMLKNSPRLGGKALTHWIFRYLVCKWGPASVRRGGLTRLSNCEIKLTQCQSITHTHTHVCMHAIRAGLQVTASNISSDSYFPFNRFSRFSLRNVKNSPVKFPRGGPFKRFRLTVRELKDITFTKIYDEERQLSHNLLQPAKNVWHVWKKKKQKRLKWLNYEIVGKLFFSTSRLWIFSSQCCLVSHVKIS